MTIVATLFIVSFIAFYSTLLWANMKRNWFTRKMGYTLAGLFISMVTSAIAVIILA